MAHRVITRGKEQAASGGTGAFTLGGAPSGYVAFSDYLTANGDTSWYLAANAGAGEWESGILTRTGPGVYARTIITGSNGANPVNFTAAPVVFSDMPGAALGYRQPRTALSHPLVKDPADDEFEADALDTAGTRFAGATAWAWRNQGAATATLAQGSLVLAAPAGASTDQWRWIEQTLPATGTWKYRARVAVDVTGTNSNAGFGLYASGTGKLTTIGIQTGTPPKVFVGRYNSPTAFNATIFATTDLSGRIGNPASGVWTEIEWDGATFHYRVSATGINGTFIELANETPAAFLGTPDKIWIGADGYSGPVLVVADCMRRVF